MVDIISDRDITACGQCGVVFEYNRDLKCPLCTALKLLKKTGK